MNKRERELKRMIKDWNVVQHRRGQYRLNNNDGLIATINLHPKLSDRERELVYLLLSEIPIVVESFDKLLGLTALAASDFTKIEELIDTLKGEKKDTGMLGEICDF